MDCMLAHQGCRLRHAVCLPRPHGQALSKRNSPLHDVEDLDGLCRGYASFAFAGVLVTLVSECLMFSEVKRAKGSTPDNQPLNSTPL